MAANDGFGMFLIVLLMAVVALGAGALFIDNGYQVQDKVVAQAGMEQATVQLVEAKKMIDQQAAKINGLTAQIDAISKERQAAQEANNSLRRQLEETRATLAAAQAANQATNGTVANLQAQLNEAQADLAEANRINAGLLAQLQERENQKVVVPQQQAVPQETSGRASVNLFDTLLESQNSLLVIVGGALGTLVLVIVFASFRALPHYDEEPRKNNKTGPEGETIYVRMTRDEAAKYANDRNQATRPSGTKKSPYSKQAQTSDTTNTRRDPDKEFNNHGVKRG